MRSPQAGNPWGPGVASAHTPCGAAGRRRGGGVFDQSPSPPAIIDRPQSPEATLVGMRQRKTFFVLVVFACMLSMTSCGAPEPATPAGSSQNATVRATRPARAAPSAAAKMICARETQTELAAVLGVHTTQPVVPTWADHLYSCRYTYHDAFMVLSVKDLSNRAETDGYFTSLAHRLGQAQRPQAIDRGAFSPPGTARSWSARMTRSFSSTSPGCPPGSVRRPPPGRTSRSRSRQRSWTAGQAADHT